MFGKVFFGCVWSEARQSQKQQQALKLVQWNQKQRSGIQFDDIMCIQAVWEVFRQYLFRCLRQSFLSSRCCSRRVSVLHRPCDTSTHPLWMPCVLPGIQKTLDSNVQAIELNSRWVQTCWNSLYSMGTEKGFMLTRKGA